MEVGATSTSTTAQAGAYSVSYDASYCGDDEVDWSLAGLSSFLAQDVVERGGGGSDAVPTRPINRNLTSGGQRRTTPGMFGATTTTRTTTTNSATGAVCPQARIVGGSGFSHNNAK